MSATPNTPTPSDVEQASSLLTGETTDRKQDACATDVAARSFLWRYLGAAFSFPDEATVTWLNSETTQRTLESAVAAVCRPEPSASPSVEYDRRPELSALIERRYNLNQLQSAYLAVFGHTVRGDCPPHEIEYGELKADALFQPHRLADIAAFYRAFGLEVTSDANDRVDNIAMECEFFSVLCAKEAATDQTEHLEICRNAQKQFLREHLARWVPAFTRRVESLAADEFFPAHARLLRETVTAECARYGLQSGNSDLQLRPAGDLEDPCGSCGLAGTQFPGAVAQAT